MKIGVSYRHSDVIFNCFLALTTCLAISSCSVRKLPWVGESCTIRADIEEQLPEYLKAHYQRDLPVRYAVMPFDVPVNFAGGTNLTIGPADHTGMELARRVQSALLATRELDIVEVFDRQNWPRKREEFFTGNYNSIQQAHDSGYDFLIVGVLEPIVDDKTLSFQTKVIDLASNTTVWSGNSLVSSNAREWDKAVLNRESFKARFDLFAFKERFQKFAECFSNRLINGPDEEDGGN